MTNIPGGWTDWSFTLSKEAETVFEKAMKGFVGVHYTPLAFATQVVAGTNYSFLSKGKPVYPNAADIAVKIYIYQPLSGDPHLKTIEEIKP